MRREGRLSDSAILISRLIDRPLRPLYKGFMNEVQVIVTALARDELHLDILGIIEANGKIHISDIPLGKADQQCESRLHRRRIRHQPDGRADGSFRAGPAHGRHRGRHLMVEAGADELPEDVIAEALGWAGHVAHHRPAGAHARGVGQGKVRYVSFIGDPAVEEAAAWLGGRIEEILARALKKQEQSAAMKALAPGDDGGVR